MKIIDFTHGVTMRLNPTECLLIADALAVAEFHDKAPNLQLNETLAALFTVAAMAAAAPATLSSADSPGTYTLDQVRADWLPEDDRYIH